MSAALCVELDCGQPSDHRNHARSNPAGHFFNTRQPLLSSSNTHQQTPEPKQEKPMMPGPRPRRRMYVKSRTLDDQTVPAQPEESAPLSDEEPIDDLISRLRPTTPPLRTESVIMDAVVKAIRSIDISSRIRIAAVNVLPQYSVSDDAIPIAAKVSVSFSMVFPAAEGE